MYILEHRLTPDSKIRVLEKTTAFGDEWLEHGSIGKREQEIAALPMGESDSPHNRVRLGL